jgi:hypothetical protein
VLPPEDVPELNMSNPLAPVVPALILRIAIKPDVVAVPKKREKEEKRKSVSQSKNIQSALQAEI